MKRKGSTIEELPPRFSKVQIHSAFAQVDASCKRKADTDCVLLPTKRLHRRGEKRGNESDVCNVRNNKRQRFEDLYAELIQLRQYKHHAIEYMRKVESERNTWKEIAENLRYHLSLALPRR